MTNEAKEASASQFGASFSVEELNALIDGLSGHDCWELRTLLRSRAKEVAARDPDLAAPWDLLAEVCGMMFHPSEPVAPFRPLGNSSDGQQRTFMPEDLTSDQRSWLAGLLDHLTNPELRARIADVAWVAWRDAKAARAAVASYIDSASGFGVLERWLERVDRLERALWLAKLLRDESLVEVIAGQLEELAKRFTGDESTGFLGVRALKLLLESAVGDLEAVRSLAQKGAEAARTAEQWRRCRGYLEIVQAVHRQLGNALGIREAALAIAETFVSEATAAEKRSALAAMHHLQKAIEAMRRVGGQQARVEELHARLLEVQGRAVGELHPVKVEVDVDAQTAADIRAAREAVSGRPLREALVKLAALVPWMCFDALRRQAEELVKEFPLQSLFGSVLMDERGRVLSNRPPPITEDDSTNQGAGVAARTLEMAEMERSYRVAAKLQPAVEQLSFEHAVTMHDIADLVAGSAFVPADREWQFTKGLVAWFHRDLVVAVHLLVPQIENSIRHLLTGRGAVVTRIDQRGVQREMDLDDLLDHPRIGEIFPADLVLECRTLLTDRRGPHLRHRIAHGLLSDAASASQPVFYACWLVFRLCVFASAEWRQGKGDAEERRETPPPTTEPTVTPGS